MMVKNNSKVFLWDYKPSGLYGEVIFKTSFTTEP